MGFEESKSWAIQVAKYIRRISVWRINLLFVAVFFVFTLSCSYLIRFLFNVPFELVDVVTASGLTLICIPWMVYFLSELVAHLEESRDQLEDAVEQLEFLRNQDKVLNQELQNNIRQLNYEIEQRRNAQLERETVFEELEREIRDKSEQELQARRLSTLLRSIIDASPDLIYYRNEEGRFAGCNRVAEELTGRSERELLGLTPHEVYDEELARQVAASDHEVLQNDASITEELWLKFSDGRRRFFEMRKVPFYDSDGHRLGLLAFGRDMTERKKAESAVLKATTDKSRFIATISHELRTPLNGIVGLSRMLREAKLPPDEHQWASTIYASATTLGNIFNDIIDIDKLEREKLELFLKTVSVRTFVNEISSVIKLMAEEKALDHQVTIIEPMPERIEIDGTRLRQVLWNLLYNAVKFTREGCVCLKVSAQDITATHCNLILQITDTGIGIPADELDNIFAMYYQVASKEHQSATGTGIGLAICKQIIDRMNGHIQVKSEVGKGSEFRISLPVSISEQAVTLETIQVTGLRVLLVEDIELNITVAKALLEKLGQTVEVARTGTEAIEKIRQQPFDLILLDIQLPDFSGFQVADRINQEGLLRQSKVVALTANVVKKIDDYKAAGMLEVITKPLKKSRVISVINELFANATDASVQPSASTATERTPTEDVLDFEMLALLDETLGLAMLSDSIDIFEHSVHEYMDSLQTAIAARAQEDACGHAHKIKGAASSIGLKRVRIIANTIQNADEHPAWWENVEEWAESLNQAIDRDCSALRAWVNTQLAD